MIPKRAPASRPSAPCCTNSKAAARSLWAPGRASQNGVLQLDACLLSPDGKECLRGESIGEIDDAEEIGKRLGKILRDDGAERILGLAGRPVGGRASG